MRVNDVEIQEVRVIAGRRKGNIAGRTAKTFFLSFYESTAG